MSWVFKKDNIVCGLEKETQQNMDEYCTVVVWFGWTLWGFLSLLVQ